MNNIKKAFKDKSRLRCMADGGFVKDENRSVPRLAAEKEPEIFRSEVGGVPTFTDQYARRPGAIPYTPGQSAQNVPVNTITNNVTGATRTAGQNPYGMPVSTAPAMENTGRELLGMAKQVPVFGPMVAAADAAATALRQSPYEKMNGLAAGSRSTPESNVPSWVRGPSAGGLRPGGLDPSIIANAAKFDQPADTRPMWQRAPKMDISMTSPVANGQFGNVGQPQTAPAPMWQRQPMQDVGMDYISKTGGYGPTKKPEPVAQMADGGAVPTMDELNRERAVHRLGQTWTEALVQKVRESVQRDRITQAAKTTATQNAGQLALRAVAPRLAPLAGPVGAVAALSYQIDQELKPGGALRRPEHPVSVYFPDTGQRFPARSGPVRGPGGPTDDKVPAMLSDGEYVLPADTVKAVGVDKLNALRDATHTPTGKAKYQQGLRRYSDGDYVYRVDTKGNAIPTSNAPGGRAMIPAGPVPAAPLPGAPGSAAYRFVNAQTTPAPSAPSAPSATKSAIRIGGAGLAAGGAIRGALDTLNDSPQFIANYDNAMGLDPNAGPVARTFASDIPRVLERTGDAIGFGLPGRIGRGIAESIGGGSFMTGFASDPDREAPRNTGAAPVAEATNEPEAQTGSAKPTPTRTAAAAPNGMNEIQREALGAARSQLRDRGGGGYYAQVPRNEREINARYDKLGRELRGMYSSKGQGNLARKLLELEAARGRELGFDQRGAIDLAGMNSGANTAANAQRNQVRMAAANDLSALGNTQAMNASNSLLAQSRVDAENIAAQAKAASDAAKASARAEKEGITREEKGLEDIRSSIRDRFAEDPELADAVSSRILGAGKNQIGNIAALTGQDRAAAIDHVVEMANLAEQQDRYASNPYGFDAPKDAGLPMPVEMREPRFFDDAASRGVLRALGAEVLDVLPFTGDQTVVRDQSGRVMPAPKNERTRRAIRKEIERSSLRNKRGDN